MFLQLFRTQSIAETTMGRMYVDGKYYCDTIENAEKQIPTGYYPIRMTYSPHFQEVLPLLDNVVTPPSPLGKGVVRTGIRIHPGNTYRDSSGCILVGQLDAPSSPTIAYNRPSSPTNCPSSPYRLLSSRKTFDPLCESMRVVAGKREPIWIQIVDASPEKIRQDKLYDEATRSMKNVDDYTWVSIPEEVIDLLRLQGKWDSTPTWQEQR